MTVATYPAESPPGLVPRPDPTLLTTEQLHREIKSLREIIETRLDGMDIATQLLSTSVNRVPSDVDKQIAHLRSLHEERFDSIDKEIGGAEKSVTLRFSERDTRSEREARDNKTAVDAAFAAQKEAVAEQNKSNALAIAKSETAVAKQIDGLAAAVDSKFKATDDKIDDIKTANAASALTITTLSTRVASQRLFEQENQTQKNWSTGTILATVIGGIGLLVSVMLLIFLVVHG